MGYDTIYLYIWWTKQNGTASVSYTHLTRLYRFADMQQKEFLKIFMKRYEVDLIRYCLRIVFNHSNVPFDLNYKKPFFDKYSKIRIDQLVTAKNIDHLVDYLKNTEYYAPLSRIRESGCLLYTSRCV